MALAWRGRGQRGTVEHIKRSNEGTLYDAITVRSLLLWLLSLWSFLLSLVMMLEDVMVAIVVAAVT
jgi:hypothetical protein